MEGLKEDVKDILMKNNFTLNNFDILKNLKNNIRYRRKNKLNSIIFNILKQDNDFSVKGTVSKYRVYLISKHEPLSTDSTYLTNIIKYKKKFFLFNFHYINFLKSILNSFYLIFLSLNIDIFIFYYRLEKSKELIINDFVDDSKILYFINVITFVNYGKTFIIRYSSALFFLCVINELLILNNIDFELTDAVYTSLIYFNFFIIFLVSFVNKKFNLQELIIISSISYLFSFLYKQYSFDFLLDDNKYLFFDIYHVIFLFILTVFIKYINEILKIISLFIFLFIPLYVIYQILQFNGFDLISYFKMLFYFDMIETVEFNERYYIIFKPILIIVISLVVYITYISMRTLFIVFDEFFINIYDFVKNNLKVNEIIKWLGFNEIIYKEDQKQYSYLNQNYFSLIFQKKVEFMIYLNLFFLLILFMFFNDLLKNIYYTNYFEKNNSYCYNLSEDSIIYKYNGRVKLDLFFTDIDSPGNEKLREYINKYNIDIDDEKNRFIDFYCEVKYI